MTYLMAEIRVQGHEAGLPTPDPRVLTSCLPGYYYRGFLTCIIDITDITDTVTAVTVCYYRCYSHYQRPLLYASHTPNVRAACATSPCSALLVFPPPRGFVSRHGMYRRVWT